MGLRLHFRLSEEGGLYLRPIHTPVWSPWLAIQLTMFLHGHSATNKFHAKVTRLAKYGNNLERFFLYTTLLQQTQYHSR